MRVFLSCAVLFFVAFFCFANTLNYPFVHDDIVFIAQNPQISRLDNLHEIFLPNISAHPQGVNTYYRPVLEVIYRLEYRLFGLNPAGYHLINILLHALNGVLLFLLLSVIASLPAGKVGREATKQSYQYLPFWVSLFFLIHPVQSEAVSCVAGISNLLMTSFVLLALLAYFYEVYFLTGVLLIVAMLTKEQAVMLPLLIIWLENRGQRPIFRWGILLGVTLSLLLWRGVVTGSSLISDILQSPSELILRLKAIAPVLLNDLRLIIAPYDLHYYRCYDILQPSMQAWLGLAVLILAGAFFYRRCIWLRAPLLIGGGWFFITLSPLLNIVPLVNEYSLILTADHFLYLPIIGVLIVMATVILRLNAEGSRNLTVYCILIILAIACFFTTIRQNSYWRHEIPLFEQTVRFEPQFGRGHLLLAKAYYFNGQLDRADRHFSKAYAIMSYYAAITKVAEAKAFYFGFVKGILFDWAHVFEARGEWQRALDKYNQAIEIDPYDPVLRQNAAICNNYLSSVITH